MEELFIKSVTNWYLNHLTISQQRFWTYRYRSKLLWLNEPLLAFQVWVNCLLLLLSRHLLELLFRRAPSIHEVQLLHLRQLTSRHPQLSCIDLLSPCIFILLLFLSIHQHLWYLEVLLRYLLKIHDILLKVRLLLLATILPSTAIICLSQILPLLVVESCRERRTSCHCQKLVIISIIIIRTWLLIESPKVALVYTLHFADLCRLGEDLVKFLFV